MAMSDEELTTQRPNPPAFGPSFQWAGSPTTLSQTGHTLLLSLPAGFPTRPGAPPPFRFVLASPGAPFSPSLCFFQPNPGGRPCHEPDHQHVRGRPMNGTSPFRPRVRVACSWAPASGRFFGGRGGGP